CAADVTDVFTDPDGGSKYKPTTRSTSRDEVVPTRAARERGVGSNDPLPDRLSFLVGRSYLILSSA
ncbi:MAG: hypothetical protein ACXVEG_07030, partial [Actinomycetota bacterium]